MSGWGSDGGFGGLWDKYTGKPTSSNHKSMSCIAKGNDGIGDKKSKYDDKTPWISNNRNITCTYESTGLDGKKTEIKASHSEWYLLGRDNDNGMEGQCLGAVYGKPTYSTFKNRDIYHRTHFGSFNPEKPKYPSNELDQWTQEQRKNHNKK